MICADSQIQEQGAQDIFVPALSVVTLDKMDFQTDPALTYTVKDNIITVHADTFAQWVELDSPDSDFILSDNYFDMEAGTRTLIVLEGTAKNIRLRSAYDIR